MRLVRHKTGRSRAATLGVAVLLHVAAVAGILLVGHTQTSGPIPIETPLTFRLAAPQGNGGGGGPVTAATPRKVRMARPTATPEMVAVAPIPTPDPATDSDTDIDTDTDSGTAVPGGPGIGNGPRGGGSCVGPACGDCVGPDCAQEEEQGVRPLFQIKPVYPPAARSAGITGTIDLEIIVGIDGRVVSARYLSGPAVFAPSALEAVRAWRYEPLLKSGRPIVWKSTVHLNFELR